MNASGHLSRLIIVLACFLCALSGVEQSTVGADDAFFESRIRPILIEHCESCHSEKIGKTQGGLALDTREGWQHGSDSGPVIVPGNPSESRLFQAIMHAAGISPMPPLEGGKPLSRQQIDDIATWIAQGALDPRSRGMRLGGMSLDDARNWWSLQPLQIAIPPTVQADLVHNEIDQFVVGRLMESGLRPNETADRISLIRRATFDLTGLPPTPEEVQSFLNDPSDDAFARVIDRLLASPAYGERYGRHWLDVARYADTAGDGADYPVLEARLYRDWVIRAFQTNMPWDEFIRQQIAGDIIAKDKSGEQYADSVTATGFLAIGKRYGYSPSPDFQHLDFADVIDSLGRSILGLSVGCARCHDHKYDPITVQDYYALYGILQSTQWPFPGGEEHKRPANFAPLIPRDKVQEIEQTKRLQLAELDRLIDGLNRKKLEADPRFYRGGIDLDLESQELGKPPSTPWLSAGPNVVREESQSPFQHIFGSGYCGVQLGSGLPNDGLRYVLPAPLSTATSAQICICVDFRTQGKTNGGSQDVSQSNLSGSYRFYFGRGVLESTAIEVSIGETEIAIREGGNWKVVSPLARDQWYHLRLNVDRESRTFSGTLDSIDKQIALGKFALPSNWDGVIDTFFCDAIGHRSGPAPVRDIDNLGFQSEPFPVFGSPPAQRTSTSQGKAADIAELDGEIAKRTAERGKLAAELSYPVAYGLSEGSPTDARIQLRGEPEKLGEPVPRRFLEVLGHDPLPGTESGSGRLALADWLTRRSNPLSARVWVNRVWHWHFGRGIVPTTSDFGVRGEPPSNPQLLDWLTARFIDSGWDVKSLHRMIMLSRTYQLSSTVQDSSLISKAQAIDPENRLLWRSTRRPLDAESLRDALLQTGGLIDRSLPTPHPFPAVDTWGFTIHQPFHAVYDSNRRSVYLMIQRNRRHPFLSLFDSADPNLSIAERVQTVTPTQSLFLMNSPLVHNAAKSLSQQIRSHSSETKSRIQFAYCAAYGRLATELEVEHAEAFMIRFREVSSGFDPEEVWAAFSRVLLTSNPFLYVD